MTARAEAASGAKKPPGAAARSEKNGKPKKVEWRGRTWTLPPNIEGVDGDLLFAMSLADEDGREMIKVLRALLGDEQLGQIRALLREEKRTIGDLPDELGPLFNKAMDAYGTTPGESSASTKSSETTGDS